ncbi:WXG100 family type VII secretion target [Micromonospora sp. NPDC006766]|uniref:WXG100 family type VII secretion target n=1 Tax=Micromonospora sp. NPDC006766 TaxID=3154778 RepID=UPI0033E64B59
MRKVDPDMIDKAANNVMSEPLAYMKVAKEHVERDCKGHPVMLGVIGTPAILTKYQPSYDAFLQSVSGGVDKFKEMANGLSYTAANWAKAEHANTPTGSPTEVRYKKPEEGSSNAANVFEGTGLYWLSSIAVLALAGEGAIAACGALSPTALIAVAAWALWTPDDAELSRVQNGWEAASGAVQAAIDQLDAALRPLNGAWEADDRRAFDVWLASFKTELGQTRDDLKAMSEAIKTAHDNINDAQFKFFVFATICLAMIIAYSVFDATPFAPVAEALKVIQSIMLNISASTTVAWIGQAAVFAVAASVIGKDTINPDIPTLTNNADGHGTGLQDIKIDWDNAYQARYEH